jgi:hypothetical protein
MSSSFLFSDGVLAFAAYTLAFTVSKLDDPIRQRVAVYVWLGVFLTISSMLLNIFRMKKYVITRPFFIYTLPLCQLIELIFASFWTLSFSFFPFFFSFSLKKLRLSFQTISLIQARTNAKKKKKM